MSRVSKLRLGVNVDHVATLRQVRRASYPDPVEAALAAERGGADLITVHLREDRRHIQERDVEVLRKVVKTHLNLEMAATQDMVKLALDLRPDTVTFVPERRQELTTEGGLDASALYESLRPMVRLLEDADIRVSLFIDPEVDQIRASHRLDVAAVELHTGRFAETTGEHKKQALVRIVDGAKVARKLGLEVAAGHGLHYHNVGPIAAIAEIEELNIGHSIVARAVVDGMERATREMVARMAEARAG